MKPNCYGCAHRRQVPGDAHSACANRQANVVGKPRGLRMGWFVWPWSFDPVWLESCDGYEPKQKEEQ